MAAAAATASGSGAGAGEAPEDKPIEVFRKDYKRPPFLVKHIELDVSLEPEATVVSSRLTIVRSLDHCPAGTDLELDGADIIEKSTRRVAINDKDLADSASDGAAAAGADTYTIVTTRGNSKMVIPEAVLPAGDTEFVFASEVTFSPKANLQLQGLYMSKGLYCTQCEATGFRRITWHTDRPDVLSTYRVRVEANKEDNPVLLSNGNVADSGDVDGDATRHYMVYDDPSPKPSYLFALVAGQLGHLEDSFTTKSGRVVRLRAYAQPDVVDRLSHAMASLKRAMKWDEDTFGLEYYLDNMSMVGVDDFNQGAMENQSLLIFTTPALLHTPTTTTDDMAQRIEGIVGHEYFHSWSGNKVTVRSWFELCLKEGLTKFRDGWFSADCNGHAHRRIVEVKRLREAQFPEDAGPMAHPCRPDSYISFESYYSATGASASARC